jgi:hypothetical protein
MQSRTVGTLGSASVLTLGGAAVVKDGELRCGRMPSLPYAKQSLPESPCSISHRGMEMARRNTWWAQPRRAGRCIGPPITPDSAKLPEARGLSDDPIACATLVAGGGHQIRSQSPLLPSAPAQCDRPGPVGVKPYL